jgi:hypothetical protein
MSKAEIHELNAKLECYETCIDQLRKEIPKYLTKYSDVNKDSIKLIKVLRNVASLEPDNNFQSALFLCAMKYEQLQTDRKILDRCHEYTNTLFDDAKDKMITPLKASACDVIHSYTI